LDGYQGGAASEHHGSDSNGDEGETESAGRAIGLHSFELLRVLGKGSYGKVMLVRHLGIQRLYAMKTLHKKELRKKKQLLHTATERAILQQLRHPFLTRLEFAFQSAGKLYLIMDFCSGGEMFYWMQQAVGDVNPTSSAVNPTISDVDPLLVTLIPLVVLLIPLVALLIPLVVLLIPLVVLLIPLLVAYFRSSGILQK
jgi:hypothetical protein